MFFFYKFIGAYIEIKLNEFFKKNVEAFQTLIFEGYWCLEPRVPRRAS